MKKYLLYASLLTSVLLFSCSKNNPNELVEDRSIEISIRVDDFTKTGEAVRYERNQGSAAERLITNLYLLLFDQSGANPAKYYITGNTFTGGTWLPDDMKVKLDMTQSEAGERKVYVVANVDNAVKTALDAVANESDLQTVKRTTAMPWSTDIASPFLMSGNKTHDFLANRLLDNVPLVRAIAKVELNISLSEKFQILPTIVNGSLSEFKFRYVNFDKETYVVKPTTKPDNLISSANGVWPQITDWTVWGASLNASPAPDAGIGYTLDANGKVTALRIITYLNERDSKGAIVEIALPRVDDGTLPPPEFGPELYRLPLPDKILRNNWYKYDIES
ncbi:minor fimbrial subunit Mfa4 [Porphyromonas gingivalis]|uniref:minor fimbrial subunit Mfa4 n=1 Tax=Porphyromonas gingivalis TaxID=837 RepID=UPI001F36CF25|nr:minor fimbrial subunit Mfa4 [Porphyromonas gingivalis]MCE8164377.1 minor fimbrial subunit Mfa4 [Porphyromonas gingivalis]MCE8180018.1 minor fimbrial subunit Mfa4 [Porphyromonas gingivalis]